LLTRVHAMEVLAREAFLHRAALQADRFGLELVVLLAEDVDLVLLLLHLLALGQVRAGREHEHEEDRDERERSEGEPGARDPAHPRPRPASARRPMYCASSPSSSSMRSSWLYFATRSLRAGAPVLICPQFVATARSAMVASSVSPLRCDITHVYACRAPSATVSSVSLSEPIWFTLVRIGFAAPWSIARCSR